MSLTKDNFYWVFKAFPTCSFLKKIRTYTPEEILQGDKFYSPSHLNK